MNNDSFKIYIEKCQIHRIVVNAFCVWNGTSINLADGLAQTHYMWLANYWRESGISRPTFQKRWEYQIDQGILIKHPSPSFKYHAMISSQEWVTSIVKRVYSILFEMQLQGKFDDVKPDSVFENPIVQKAIRKVMDTIWLERMRGEKYYVNP